jgi:hypothetical protein
MFSELAIKISADIKDFQKGLGEFESNLDKISKGIGNAGLNMTKFVTGPILALGGGLLALATKTGNFADRILDLEQITGMSTDAIQQFQNVAKIAGVETEAVTSASEKLTRQMSELETGTGKGAEALADLGIEFGDLEKMTPDQRMQNLIVALSEIVDPAERARIGTDLLRNSWRDIAPIVALGADGIAEARQAAIDMGAVMGNQALNDANNFRIGMENLKTEFMAAGQGIMNEFLPILTEDLMPFITDTVIPKLREFAEMIRNVFARFRELSPETQGNIVKFILLVAAIGPVLLIIAKLIAIVKGVIIVVKALSTALLFLNANPIGLIILGIAALIAIGVLLYKNWDTVKEFAIKTWEFIKGLLDTNIGKIVAILSGPIGIGLLIIANWELIRDKATEIFNKVKDTLKNIFIGIKDFILNIFNSIENGITNAINRVKNIIEDVLGFFRRTKETIDNFTSGAKNTLSNVGGFIKSKIPFMAEGGIVTAPTLAMIGEDRNPEMVIPLNKFASLTNNRQTNIYLDGREITRTIAPHMVDTLRTKLAY